MVFAKTSKRSFGFLENSQVPRFQALYNKQRTKVITFDRRAVLAMRSARSHWSVARLLAAPDYFLVLACVETF